jgi:hypothetical protein
MTMKFCLVLVVFWALAVVKYSTSDHSILGPGFASILTLIQCVRALEGLELPTLT